MQSVNRYQIFGKGINIKKKNSIIDIYYSRYQFLKWPLKSLGASTSHAPHYL